MTDKNNELMPDEIWINKDGRGDTPKDFMVDGVYDVKPQWADSVLYIRADLCTQQDNVTQEKPCVTNDDEPLHDDAITAAKNLYTTASSAWPSAEKEREDDFNLVMSRLNQCVELKEELELMRNVAKRSCEKLEKYEKLGGGE